MSSQKLSQLNRDYAKDMVLRDKVFLKRSARRGIGSFLVGLVIVFLVLMLFFFIKYPLLSHFHKAFSSASQGLEKTKHASSKKYLVSDVVGHAKQEYGFYTVLPKMEVKSPHREEDEAQ
jgi:hypothetical protein